MSDVSKAAVLVTRETCELSKALVENLNRQGMVAQVFGAGNNAASQMSAFCAYGESLVVPLVEGMQLGRDGEDVLFIAMRSNIKIIPVGDENARIVWRKIIPLDLPELNEVPAHVMDDGWQASVDWSVPAEYAAQVALENNPVAYVLMTDPEISIYCAGEADDNVEVMVSDTDVLRPLNEDVKTEQIKTIIYEQLAVTNPNVRNPLPTYGKKQTIPILIGCAVLGVLLLFSLLIWISYDDEDNSSAFTPVEAQYYNGQSITNNSQEVNNSNDANGVDEKQDKIKQETPESEEQDSPEADDEGETNSDGEGEEGNAEEDANGADEKKGKIKQETPESEEQDSPEADDEGETNSDGEGEESNAEENANGTDVRKKIIEATKRAREDDQAEQARRAKEKDEQEHRAREQAEQERRNKEKAEQKNKQSSSETSKNRENVNSVDSQITSEDVNWSDNQKELYNKITDFMKSSVRKNLGVEDVKKRIREFAQAQRNLQLSQAQIDVVVNYIINNINDKIKNHN